MCVKCFINVQDCTYTVSLRPHVKWATLLNTDPVLAATLPPAKD